VRALVFPLVVGVGLGGASLALEAGARPELVIVLASLVGALMIILFERLLPYTEVWRESRGDLFTDAAHTLVSMGIVPKLCELATLGLTYAVAAWLSEQVGATLWPQSWPLVVQLTVALVAAEFGQYWVHRWMHEVPMLWRLHAVHHSAQRLYWLNAGRFHPLDTALTYPVQALPLALCGAGPEVLAMFAVFTSLHGMMQHANIDVRLGPLNWVFSMAELHRWHHARELADANSNYGANLILWDVVFGTRHLPADRSPSVSIGFEGDEAYPQQYLGQLAAPFTSVLEEPPPQGR